MKNKLKRCLLCLLLIGFGVLIVSIFNKKETVLEEKPFVKKDVNTLSMMLETEAGSGNYEMTTASSWPTDGYIFNSELSRCENGGELSWDDTTKQVLMSSNMSDKCYVYFDKYSLITITNYNITSSANSININVTAQAGTGTIAKYYYSKDNGLSYAQSTNNTYTFSNLDMGTYNIKAYVQDSNGKNSEIIGKSITISAQTLASWIKSKYTTQGANELYHHDGTLTNGINDGSYRYAGANPSNYICLGSTASPCPDTNLFRIIGVFGEEVKVIRAKSYDNIQWQMWSSTWSSSTINYHLQHDYLTSLGSMVDKIAMTTWKVGGNSGFYSETAKEVYQNEVVSPIPGSSGTNGETDYSAKIGLMYVCDYMYAIPLDNWTFEGKSYYSVTNLNWLFTGNSEWTITRFSGTSTNYFWAYCVSENGSIDNKETKYSLAVRPVFYLDSFVTYKSGTGVSSTDPIRIN